MVWPLDWLRQIASTAMPLDLPERASEPWAYPDAVAGHSAFVADRSAGPDLEQPFRRGSASLGDSGALGGRPAYARLAALANPMRPKPASQGPRPPAPLAMSSTSGSGEPTDLTGTQPWRPLIDAQAKAVAQQYGVDPDELANAVHAVMQIESGGKQDALSPAGAVGLMQVMPFHWAPGTDVATMQDPSNNVRKGAEVLAQNLRAWGDWQRATAAYFGAIDGQGNITADQDAGGQTGQGYVDQFNRALQSVQSWRQTGRIGGPAARSTASSTQGTR